MNDAELDEAVAAVKAIGAALLATSSDWTLPEASGLRRAVGSMEANAPRFMREGSIGTAMREAFSACIAAGMKVKDCGAIRSAVLAAIGIYPLTWSVQNTAIRLSLACEAQVLSTMRFVTRAEVEAHLARIAMDFEAAETVASDSKDAGTYRALVTLRGSVVRDLIERGRRLPRRVPYSVGTIRPSLALAARFYNDANRAEEIAANNGARHPLFCPAQGTVLSV